MPPKKKPTTVDPVPRFRFDGKNLNAQRAAKKSAALMVTNVSVETKNAIRAVIVQSIQEGIAPYDAARMIRPMVGMTAQQAGAAFNYKNGLMNMGMSPIKIDAAMKRYVAKKIAERAKTIARTEIMGALNKGAGVSFLQAQKAGLLGPKAMKIWIITPDDLLCDICAGMDGARAPLDKPFGIPGPPAHPRCRCTISVDPGKGGPLPGYVAPPPSGPSSMRIRSSDLKSILSDVDLPPESLAARELAAEIEGRALSFAERERALAWENEQAQIAARLDAARAAQIALEDAAKLAREEKVMEDARIEYERLKAIRKAGQVDAAQAEALDLNALLDRENVRLAQERAFMAEENARIARMVGLPQDAQVQAWREAEKLRLDANRIRNQAYQAQRKARVAAGLPPTKRGALSGAVPKAAVPGGMSAYEVERLRIRALLEGFDMNNATSIKYLGSSTSDVYRVTFKDPVTGKELTAYLKPIAPQNQRLYLGAGGTDVDREMFGQTLDEILGTDLVPPTGRTSYAKDKYGRAMPRVDASLQFDADGTEYARASPRRKGLISRDDNVGMTMMDAIMGNTDRHGGNAYVTSKGRLRAIDQGRTYMRNADNLGQWREEVTRQFWNISRTGSTTLTAAEQTRWLSTLQSPALMDSIINSPFLSHEAKEAALGRIRALTEHVRNNTVASIFGRGGFW